MGTSEDEDLAERRRIGLELQAQLPKPLVRDRNAADDALDVADLGCMLSDLGIAGAVVATVGAVAWAVRRRRRTRK